MSSILDLAIAISVADFASSTIKNVIGQFGLLQNSSEETKKKLDGFKNMAFIGAGIAAAGAVGVAALTHLAEKAADVQQQMIQLSGVYGLNIDDSQLKAIEDQAQELSQKTLFSKKEVIGIDVELAHAGITKEALKNILPEATYLAEVEVGMGKSGSAHQTAYNFARMSEDAGITNNTERMAKFADEMNRVINVTHANSESLGETFKYAMPVVKNLGWTEQDTLLASAMAARAGVEGSMAGTHIKDFAERINPFKYLNTRGGDKQLSAMMEAGLLEGVQTVKPKGGKEKVVGFDSAALLKDKDHLKSYADMVDVLSEKYQQFLKKGGGGQEYLSEMTEEQLSKLQEKAQAMTGQKMSGGALQWAAIMNHLFGEQGQDFAIISSHKEVFDKLEGQLKIQKDLHDQIEVIRNSFKGQMHVFESNIETLGLQVGKPIMEAMIPVIKVLAEAFGHLIEVINNNPQVAKFLSLFAGAVSAFMVIGGAITIAVAAFGTLTTALAAVDISMGTVALVSGGAVLAIAAIAGAGYLIYKNWDSIGPYVKAVWDGVKNSVGNALNYIKDRFEAFKKTIDDNKTAIEVVASILGVVFGPALIGTGVKAGIAGGQIALEFTANVIKSGYESTIAAAKISGSFIVSLVRSGVEAAKTAVILSSWLVIALYAYAEAGWKAAYATGAQTVAWVANKIEIGLATAALVAQKIAMVASAIATGAVTAATWLFNAALEANPIVLVITALALLVIGIIELVKHWKDVVEWIEKAWNWLTKWNSTKVEGKGITIEQANALAGNADGTDYWSGGPTWVGEKGPEIVNLPRGSQVIPNHKLTNGIGRGGITIQGPLIGAIHQQPGENSEAFIDRLIYRLKTELGFDAEQANLTLGRTAFVGVR